MVSPPPVQVPGWPLHGPSLAASLPSSPPSSASPPLVQVPGWSLHGPQWLRAFFTASLPHLRVHLGGLQQQRLAAAVLLGIGQAMEGGAIKESVEGGVGPVEQAWIRAFWEVREESSGKLLIDFSLMHVDDKELNGLP